MAISGAVAAIGVGMGTQAYFGNKAAKSAKRAAAAAAEEMRRNKAQAIGYQQPYYAAGNQGMNVLSGLLTGNQYDAQGNVTNTLNADQRNALIKTDPGYQFRLTQGQNALQASQAAKGGLLSGGAMKEIMNDSQGVASDQYNSYVNQLFGLAGMGQQAATNMGNYAIGAGSQIANYMQQGGMAAANNYANMGNVIGGGISQMGATYLGAQLGGKMGGTGGGTGGGFSYVGEGKFNNGFFSGSQISNTNLSGGY